ncbi:MAG: metallophosphoesterase [Kiritimatiellia bacterium]
MKIAVTADVHLTARADHPERYNALGALLDELTESGIEHLIIAGDLFDRNQRDYSEFEELCRESRRGQISIHVIRGNHDRSLSSGDIALPNVHVADAPEIMRPDGSNTPFLLVPYEDVAMAERISAHVDGLEPDRWILAGHGDYTGGQRHVNPHEKGTYMPVERADLDRFKPREVFLGHIHKPHDSEMVHYAGSPCGLDINETGKRSFMVYDTDAGTMERRPVETDVLWFSETFTVVPSPDEAGRLRGSAIQRIGRWDTGPEDIPKIRVRVRATGYARDRKGVRSVLEEVFQKYRFHDETGVDFGGLMSADDERLEAVARAAIERVDKMEFPKGDQQPRREEIITAVLNTVYGS